MKVTMNPDGRTVKELNKIPKPVAGYYDNLDEADNAAWHAARGEWLAAEQSRKVYEIDGIDNEQWYTEALIKGLLKYDAIHEAELLPNGKIKLIS